MGGSPKNTSGDPQAPSMQSLFGQPQPPERTGMQKWGDAIGAFGKSMLQSQQQQQGGEPSAIGQVAGAGSSIIDELMKKKLQSQQANSNLMRGAPSLFDAKPAMPNFGGAQSPNVSVGIGTPGFGR